MAADVASSPNGVCHMPAQEKLATHQSPYFKWHAGKGRIELLLAMGATRMEATRETLQRCLILALTPVLNQMSVMGIVSIPGMMTGQILGGTDPSQVCAHVCLLHVCASESCV